ncbi:La ribonucleoprotein [Cymbomonas tetramitiformis]|uniref:La ribonucleoprotein n=1 Tax=Cymbomonas tetramitiformis TaxID=36881 RepID=A0AAE0BUI5_9CHLO|nr:La ribonucleoprotein [Cymbomonas tetramitiformis]
MGKRASKKSKFSTNDSRLPPIGKGPIKRTPNHEFDHRGNADNIYLVECILAERLTKSGDRTVEEWLIRWKGYSQAHDTWEPIENLAGLEDDIANFRREKSLLEPLKLGKRKRKTPVNDHTPVVVAAGSSAGVLSIQSGENTTPATQEDVSDEEAEHGEEILRPAMRGRRTAKVWSLFNEIICPTTDKPIGLLCAIEKCGARLASSTNTTNARQHLSYLHKAHLAELEAEEFEANFADEPSQEAAARVQSVISKNSAVWPPGKRDTLTRKVVNWLCKRARPLSLPERDTELSDVLMFASEGAYSMPSKHNVVRQLCVISGKALVHDRQKVVVLKKDRVLPSSAIDIWSENGIALLGILLYFWAAGGTAISELLVRAVPFGEVAHTGTEIELATKRALAHLGVGEFREPTSDADCFEIVDTVRHCLHKAVADGASNVQKGLAEFETSPCPAHVGQRCVLAYLEVPLINAVHVKTKGIAALFRRSPLGLSCLHRCQTKYQLPTTQPPRSVAVRWNSTFLQWQWFPPQQTALQMFDVESMQLKLSTDEIGSTYRDFQLDLTDWQLIQQSLPVLEPVNEYTRIIQGTRYVTMSLVLPMTAWLIEFELKPSVDVVLADGTELKHTGLLPAVREGREAMYTQFEQRWCADLPMGILEDYTVSTLLDPRWKNWDFDGCNIFDYGSMTRERALSFLRTAWTDFKPALSADSARLSSCASEKRATGESSFMRKKKQTASSSTLALVIKDQLDTYLSLPQEANEEGFDVMLWWNEKAKDLPDVYRMARQFLGCPATTGGVERTFSAAGRMHDDLRKSTDEDTLEHMLRVRISDCS